jgi:hypothetical protein
MARMTMCVRGFTSSMGSLNGASMENVAKYGLGRILLHLLALAGDGEFRFHAAGIVRECELIVRP